MAPPGPPPPPPGLAPHGLRTVRILLGCLAAGLLLFLVRADKPWQGRIGARLAAGERLSLSQSIRAGLYAAAAADLLIVLALLGTARIWMRPLSETDLPPGDPRPPLARGVALALTAACLVGAVVRVPLASRSLWWDEIWNLRKAVVGERTLADPAAAPADEPVFVPVDWGRTLFHYSKPTNHIPFSVASRISLAIWRRVTGSPPWAFSEFWFRLPNLIAAVMAIGLIGRLLVEWRSSAAGVAAAFLLALHPWHIRYGVDGRAFSFLLLLGLLGCWALTHALRDGSWHAWIGFGLVQSAAIWTFPYAFHLSLTLGLAALAGIFVRFGPGRTAWTLVARCAVGHATGLLFLLPLIAPLIPQILRWTDVKGNAMVHAAFLRDLWAAFAIGMPWTQPLEPGAAGLPTLESLVRDTPPAGWMVLGLFPLLATVGLVRVLRRDRTVRCVLLGLLLPAPLAVGLAWAAGHYFYTRYVNYSLPAFLILLVYGTEAVATALARRQTQRTTGRAAAVGLALLVLTFALVTHPQRLVLLTRPIAPQREVASFLAARAATRPILAAGANLGGDTPAVYYPWIATFETRAELAALASRAATEGRELVVFYGYNSFNRADAGDLFLWLDDPARFEPLRGFSGIESQFHYTVLRHTGRPLQVEEKEILGGS